MEIDGDDLDNIFEENEGREDDAENRESTEQSAGVRVAPPKRIVKNPRLKFNPERLCGKRGIPVLVDHFKNVKFKGKGHEKEDLDKLLASLEHWTHRLFPSMKFEDCLNQIEKLGKKRPVQTCLRKIRLDMPLLDSDFVKDDDEEEDTVHRNDDPDPPAVDAFDRLIEESQVIVNQEASSKIAEASSFSPKNSDNASHILGSSFGVSLTDEQKERMEHNRLLAAERRKAKLAAMQMNTSNSQSADINATNSVSISSKFDSLMQPSGSAANNENKIQNKSDIAGLETINNFQEINGVSDSLPLDNQNSENLGLDDLIDLVDEEESVADKNITVGQTARSGSDKNDDKENCEGSGIYFNDTMPNISIPAIHLNMDISNGIDVDNTVPINILNTTTALNMNPSNDAPDQNTIIKNSNKENTEGNGISFDDTVPIDISKTTTFLNMVTSNDVTEQGAKNSNKENSDKNGIHFEDTMPINISNTTAGLNMDTSNYIFDKETAKLTETPVIYNDELLGLESMMDLVDEE